MFYLRDALWRQVSNLNIVFSHPLTYLATLASPDRPRRSGGSGRFSSRRRYDPWSGRRRGRAEAPGLSAFRIQCEQPSSSSNRYINWSKRCLGTTGGQPQPSFVRGCGFAISERHAPIVASLSIWCSILYQGLGQTIWPIGDPYGPIETSLWGDLHRPSATAGGSSMGGRGDPRCALAHAKATLTPPLEYCIRWRI